MRIRTLAEINFSALLFDSLFGLILFFGLDSFLDFHEWLPFVFYLFSTIILVHWWLVFKSADDAFDTEVSDSATDLIFGVVYLILLEYIVLYAKTFNYDAVTKYLIALFAVDLIWALVWRYVGKWKTKNKSAIHLMEQELNENIRINCVAIIPFAVLLLASPIISAVTFAIVFIAIYCLYIALTFKTKIINLDIF